MFFSDAGRRVAKLFSGSRRTHSAAALTLPHAHEASSLRRIPETIRGFGHVKEENIRKTMTERARLEAELDNSRFAAAAE